MVAQFDFTPAPARAERPIVIVGSGPVGVRCAQELHRRNPHVRLVIYGAEPDAPYNRVRLSSLLAGELNWEAFVAESVLPPESALQRRFGCAVTAIDRNARAVVDARGRYQPYSQLVIATGSTPHVPAIPCIDLAGVYTFRNVRDAQKLLARRVRSRRTVVLGGGLLGLEAARAMRRFNTEVIVVDHAARLMHRQLDELAAERLRTHLARWQIHTVLGDSVRRVFGQERVEGLELASGAAIDCDTIIVAAGIRPNIDLARRAGLSVGRGVRVDDQMRTSDPLIYAVGECAEHRDIVYGLAAPGFEQAAVAVANISGAAAHYAGSIAAMRLKVVGLPVFSMGRAAPDDLSRDARAYVHCTDQVYCRLLVERGRAVGAVAIGEAPQLARLQEAVARQRRLNPLRLHRFQRRGTLWKDEGAAPVQTWPATATVCNCTGVTRGRLGEALAAGCTTTQQLAAATGASTVCGSCTPLLAQLCGAAGSASVRGGGALLALSAIAALAALLFALGWNVDYAPSVRTPHAWDVLWRTSLWKQVSGYCALGASALALLLSLRKRVKRFSFAAFTTWRWLHAALGALGLGALVAHTGGRLGDHLNLVLMGSFLLLLVLGSASGLAVGLQHRLGYEGVAWRARAVWLHILAFWPVPALLALHIYKSYFY